VVRIGQTVVGMEMRTVVEDTEQWLKIRTVVKKIQTVVE
jgi:hypothetical protein